MPEMFHGVDELQSYLRDNGACREALAAAPGVWRRYRAWLERNGNARPLWQSR